MDALRTSLGQLKFKNIDTYIQSGNVLFETTEQDIPTLEALIETHLSQAFGFEIPTIVRTQTELQTIAEKQPFPERPSETLGIYVTFLKEVPPKEKKSALMAFSTEDETLLFQHNELYIRYKRGAGTAKLNNNFIEKKLGTQATTRNWVTLGKLVTEKIEKKGSKMKQIIAIGGGGFSHKASDLQLEKYILSQTQTQHPKICFLPQASNEDPTYIVKFFDAFTRLGAIPSWVSLFGRVENTWKEKLLSQDIIYVGGGNTKSMIALWQAWGVDQVLKEAYQKGILLAGVSAGAICWFEQGITDSVWPLGVVDGLGFLPGSACPHFDTEPERPEAYQTFVDTQKAKPGIALDDFTAAHYIDATLHQVITTKPGQKARHITHGAPLPIIVKDYFS